MKTISKFRLTALILVISFSSYGQSTISSTEVAEMKYMLEEEKLARDVYDFLGDTYDLRVFQNIKLSEQRHMDMMQGLLTKYQMDFKLHEEKGVFYDKDLQKMYDELIKRGLKSKTDALKVGKLIEETDISDLTKAKKNTDDAYVQNIYSNLIRASENHLRAFNKWLNKV